MDYFVYIEIDTYVKTYVCSTCYNLKCICAKAVIMPVLREAVLRKGA